MHPLVKIIYFILVLILMGYLSNPWLYLLFASICIVSIIFQFKNFLRIIRRMRWLFVSVLIIYAFTTPGQYLHGIPVSFAPTVEGVHLGLLQVMKLLIALGALTLLYVNSSKEQLILGLYMLLSPLRYLGFKIETFVVRLFLTLEYVEDFAMQESHQKLSFEQFDAIQQINESLPDQGVITFAVMPLKMTDKLFIGIFIFIMMSLLVLNFSYLRQW